MSTSVSIIRLSVSGPRARDLTVRTDGTAQDRQGREPARSLEVSAEEVQALVARMLGEGFLEQRDVLDRGLTRHKESFRISLEHGGEEHEVHFDGNRFAEHLRVLADAIRALVDR